jgi:hypothetical protein
MIDERHCDLTVLPVSSSETVGDHRHALRYLDLSKRCLALICGIAGQTILFWEPAKVDQYFQDLRAILAPTTLEQRFNPLDAGAEMSSLEMVYGGLVAIHESLLKESRDKCH